MNSWPLTSMQMSMVFQTLHGSVPGNYIQQLACRSDTAVSARAIETAFAIITERHPALRLQFEWESGEVSQTVAESVTVPVEVQRWEGRKAWESFLCADRVRGFDLRRAPLLRVTVFEEAPARMYLVITNHHAVLDGRSRRIVMRELFDLLRTEQLPGYSLPPPPASFTTYLEWMAAQDHSGSKHFWREYLEHLPAAVALPLPQPAGGPGLQVRGLQMATVSEGATSSLRALAADCECSLNNVVQAAWAIVLARYTGRDESVFGTTRACRHSAVDGAATEMVGLLINTVPIRVRLPQGATIRRILTELKLLQMQLRGHENTPLTDIIEAAGLGSGGSLYSAYLMFEDLGTAPTEDFPGWSIELHEQTELLNLSCTARRGTIAITLEYNPALCSEEAGARILNDFMKVMAEMAIDPDREIDAIEAFTPSILRKPVRAKPAYANVVAAVAYWSQIAPGNPAVLSDKRVLTYANLESQSNRLANHLIATGVQPGSRISLSIDRSADLVVACLGIFKAGCAYVPIDLRYPEERCRYMREDSGVAAVLDKMPECSGKPEVRPQLQLAPESDAYVIYTSGSTGKPKGVLISQASLSNLCSAMVAEFKLTPEDRVLQASTISFDISVEEIFASLWAGAAIVPASHHATSSTRDFTEFVTRWRCTVLDLPTAFWHELVAGIRETGRSLPPSVRLVAVGGEQALPGVYAAWKMLPDSRNIRWLNTYGPTETTVTATVFEPADSPIVGNLPIGTPIDGVNTYILDARFRPLPLEASGELFIGGLGVALGYLNAPELTHAKFIPDPFSPDGRMYRTGDNARLLGNGNIEFLGRRDFQVKFRGYRIELGELEGAAESHPDVHQAIAQTYGSSALVLFVVVRGGSPLGVDSLRTWLSGKLPEWMLPTAIVPLEKLPVTVGGKIDRAALGGSVAINILDRSTGCEPEKEAETDLERALIKIWQSVFQRSPIGVGDNFFSLGGYSLLGMRMLVQVEKLTGRKLRFADLSRSPTIREFARALAGETDQPLPECLVILQKSGEKPPLFCLHGAGGVIHWYNDLALRIADRPVIGVQSLENPAQALPASLDEMCESYLQAIRHIQPHGPYHFIGHSMGGMLAYHCAVLCARRGDAVAFVGTLDGWNRAADNPTAAEKLARLFRYFWSLDKKEKFEFAKEKLQWLRFEGSQRNAHAAVSGGTATLRDAIKANNVRLARQYVAPCYGGIVHVFRARKRSATEGSDAALGWGKVARSVVTVEVPGTHYSLLSPPNVDVLVDRLMSALSLM